MTQLEYNSTKEPAQADYPLLAVTGPTGSGKSDLALRLAVEFGGEIVNCDSVQVHRGLDIGSAKTPSEQRAGIPHHLLDIVPPAGDLTAGEYARLATAVLRDISQRRGLPILTGGTGFYLRALIHGLSPAPKRDEQLRSRLSAAARGKPNLLSRFLRRHDPAAALRIHANDHQKLIRAIELLGETTQPRQALSGFRVLKLALNPERAALYQRIDARAAAMFENGLLEETRALLEAGVPATAKSLETLGYRQAVAVLQGSMPLDAAIADCQLRTRHYAKRQLTWFRKEPDVQWLNGFGGDEAVRQTARDMLRAFLS